jgi:hypothetical protein
LSQQTLLNERLYAVEEIDLESAGVTTDPLRDLQTAAAREHAQPREERLLETVEEVVTPSDGGPQRLLSRGEVPRAAGKDGKSVVEPDQQLRGGQDPDASGSQLDGERESVQATADGDDIGRIPLGEREIRLDCLGSLDEEAERRELQEGSRSHPPHLAGVGKRQWGDG